MQPFNLIHPNTRSMTFYWRIQRGSSDHAANKDWRVNGRRRAMRQEAAVLWRGVAPSELTSNWMPSVTGRQGPILETQRSLVALPSPVPLNSFQHSRLSDSRGGSGALFSSSFVCCSPDHEVRVASSAKHLCHMCWCNHRPTTAESTRPAVA